MTVNALSQAQRAFNIAFGAREEEGSQTQLSSRRIPHIREKGRADFQDTATCPPTHAGGQERGEQRQLWGQFMGWWWWWGVLMPLSTCHR
jgi:hypothetical protein